MAQHVLSFNPVSPLNSDTENPQELK